MQWQVRGKCDLDMARCVTCSSVQVAMVCLFSSVYSLLFEQ